MLFTFCSACRLGNVLMDAQITTWPGCTTRARCARTTEYESALFFGDKKVGRCWMIALTVQYSAHVPTLISPSPRPGKWLGEVPR